MSDYMFMLENHLNSSQNRVLIQVTAACAEANIGVYLTGGAIRDMMGGFPVRDLDFTVETNAVKLAKSIAEHTGATITHIDETRKSVEMLFPGGVTAEIAMARTEKYAKPGGRPQVAPASIYDDLKGRDFTINAIAISLNRASRGLLIDPTNGLSELERHELRAVSNYTLYDNPVRIFRLIRFKGRLGFEIAERTQSQFANVKEAGLEKTIQPSVLLPELTHVARETNVADIITALEQEKLLEIVSPLLTPDKVNHADLAKLQKAYQLLPFGIDLHVDYQAIFFHTLLEKLSPKDKTAVLTSLGVSKEEVENISKLDAKSKKLEKDIQGASAQKPSAIYNVIAKAPGELVIYLLIHSQQRVVHDRIKNFFQKYLPIAQEVTDKDVEATGVAPGTAKFQKAKEQMINTRLDARPKKPPEVVETPPPTPAPAGAGRRG